MWGGANGLTSLPAGAGLHQGGGWRVLSSFSTHHLVKVAPRFQTQVEGFNFFLLEKKDWFQIRRLSRCYTTWNTHYVKEICGKRFNEKKNEIRIVCTRSRNREHNRQWCLKVLYDLIAEARRGKEGGDLPPYHSIPPPHVHSVPVHKTPGMAHPSPFTPL